MSPHVFRPIFFKQLSSQLYGSSGFSSPALIDAKNRTIVGRLYYYALLELREQIFDALSTSTSFNPQVLRKAKHLLYSRKVHRFIPDFLKHLGLNHYWNDFLNLQAYRHAADYYIDPSKYKSRELPNLVIDHDTFYNIGKFGLAYQILLTTHLYNLERNAINDIKIMLAQASSNNQLKKSIEDFILKY